MSSDTEEMEQKKKSQAIDRILEEDSKKLRRECKILLLGKTRSSFIVQRCSSSCPQHRIADKSAKVLAKVANLRSSSR